MNLDMLTQPDENETYLMDFGIAVDRVAWTGEENVGGKLILDMINRKFLPNNMKNIME